MVYIHKGDKVAHYGDAWRDAHLYEPGGRSDIDSFRELYGFFPTILKNMDRRFSPGYNDRWAGWVGSVKTHGYHGLKLANLLGYGLIHSLGWGRLLGWVGM